jgi:ribosomal protein L37AE/L43A
MHLLDPYITLIIMTLLVGAIIIKVLFSSTRGLFREPRGAVMVCTHCGTKDKAVRRTKGSTLIELVLWLCFLFPGLIYSLWRVSSRTWVCPSCGSDQLVPQNSPVGKSMATQQPQR